MLKEKIIIAGFIISTLAALTLNILGCASSPYLTPAAPPTGLPGVYHRVEKGETLWRISKAYDVDLEELARINRILDSSSIEIGQSIFIPNRQAKKGIHIKYANDDFIWPLKGRVIAAFGQTHNSIINKGINIQPRASFEVIAARSGKVVFYSDNFGGYGKTIIIDHADGLSTVYARNAHVFIKPGESVQKGAVIARAGSSGRDKEEYLHFEIRKGHIAQNPYYYLPR